MEDNVKQFLDKMIELQNWGVVAQYMQYLDYDFIMEHKYDFPWGTISEHLDTFNLPDWVFHACSELLDWKSISRQKISINFIHEHRDKLDWDWLLRYKQFPEGFIVEHLNYIHDWVILVSSQELSEDFLWEFRDIIDWDRVRYRRYLSMEFLRKAADYINWKYYLWNGRLTEGEMREFADYLDWESVCEYQTMSKDFIIEYWDKMNFKKLLFNYRLCLSYDFIKKFVKEKLDRWTIRDKAQDICQKYGEKFYNELIMMKNEQENYHG